MLSFSFYHVDKTLVIIAVIITAAVIFGIMVLVFSSLINQINENSEQWMVELEPHLQMSPRQLISQMQNQDIGELKILRITSLDDYFETLSPDLEEQFKNAVDTDARFVFDIDKDTKYTEKEIQEILTNVDGIKDAVMLYDWIWG